MSVLQEIAGARPPAHLDICPSTYNHRIISDLTGEEWDELVAGFSDAYYEQTHRFQGAVWGEGRVRRVAIMRNGTLVAMALALIFKVPHLNRGLALVKFAPLWRRKGKSPDREVLGYALDALIGLFVVEEKLSLSIIPPADPRFAQIHREELLVRGFRYRAIQESERFLVNTTLPSDRQLVSLDKTWRYNLRKALKKDLAVSVEESDEALADFADLFTDMEKRKNYSNSSWPLSRRALAAGCPPSIRPTLVLAREGGRAVAGAIIVHIGDTAYYLYGATSARGAELMAGYALQWWIVNWLSQRECRWYDLGGGTREDGLIHFKKGLVGKDGAVEVMPGEFTLSRDPLSGLLASSLLFIRRGRLLMRSRLYRAKQILRTAHRRLNRGKPNDPPPKSTQNERRTEAQGKNIHFEQ